MAPRLATFLIVCLLTIPMFFPGGSKRKTLWSRLPIVTPALVVSESEAGGLPPLSNVFFVRSADPEFLRTVATLVQSDGSFSATMTGSDWFAGWADLPGRPSIPYAEETGRRGLFAEGDREGAGQALIAAATFAPATLKATAGDFGFVVIDGPRTIVVRSCGGLVPWLILHTESLTVVSTRNVWFARLLPVAPPLDLLVHVTLTDGVTMPDRRTPWKGVTSLRSGFATTLSPLGRRDDVEYWNPVWATPTRSVGKKGIDEAARQLRDLLVTSLQNDLDPAGRNLMGISGGVDSSCLASLAVKAAGRRLKSFTMTDLVPTGRSLENQKFVDQILDHVDPDLRCFFAGSPESFVELAATGPRLGIPIAHPALINLPNIASTTPIVTFSGGELADDLFAGPHALWHDWLAGLHPRGLIGAARSPHNPVTAQGLVRLWTQSRLSRLAGRKDRSFSFSPLPKAFHADIREEHCEWVERTTQQFRRHRAPYAYLQASRELDGWIMQNWEACSELGIRRVVPFVTRTVFDLACSLAPGDHALPAKRLLRMGLSADVPAENLWRSDKGGITQTEVVDFEIEIPPHVVQALDSAEVSLRDITQGRTRVGSDLAYSIQILGASLVAPSRL